MQESLLHVNIKRVTLTEVVHYDLAEFHCMAEALGRHQNRLYKMVLLHPTLYDYQDDSGYMCRGGVIPPRPLRGYFGHAAAY